MIQGFIYNGQDKYIAFDTNIFGKKKIKTTLCLFILC